ncbi:glycerol-3-phosphate 1-O-acyltransferase PlsB [Noviherbaspirillum sp. UKPF54]|uniref:glycerol-3-phosphate 1-O-acyltransferase PlsB n=1 Tax=Noviherbaspirillum sp. UKPF54 TaxID=2601898 RepID=UPI0011B13EFE|nr:glycerol-3-phosphate 1-O-acyltransferase PlsB [Noviherbaspirillum sp. UKPF54]QDZ29954.1 glycerol-3-phosphate 1-O-acyltransferase PlsB [Noviherbaspirillum sp. UKPF54]
MFNILGIDRPLLHAARKLLYFWVRTHVLPQEPAALELDPAKPVVYVLQRRFLSNLLVLSRETEAAGLPPALKPLAAGRVRDSRSFFFLSRPRPWLFAARTPAYSSLMRRLVAAAHSDPAFDVQIVPVSILWGRAPDKEHSIWKLIFAESWGRQRAFRRLFTVLLHGRNTLVRFSAPLSLRAIADEDRDRAVTLRKLARVLRAHFRHQREIAIGPDLSHRRTQLDGLLEAPRVRAAIDALAQDNGGGPTALRRAQQEARGYAWEIASDYSYPVILIFRRFLTWLWTRLYDGVEVCNFDTVVNIALDHEIIYVPCHRSHIDYLLLSYVVFNHGLMVPHIAAGVNLNLPLLGGFLRRGGAFFLRRSFKGNRLYAAVLNEYLHMMIAKGYPIEYFVEGGRSRTGRLLPPMGGMLSMTVQSFLRDSSRPGAARPIAFLPVYVGYEKLFEGRTYVGELLGRPKKKESLFDLLASLRELKKNFGKVHVNFGEPIRLADVLTAEHAEWRNEEVAEDARPAWLAAGIEQLKARIASGINTAAVADPVNLVSLVLLATPRHALDEQQLARQLDAYRRLAHDAPYAGRVQVTALSGADIIAYCEKLKLLQRQPHALGDVLYFTQDDAVLATYMRNNILHLYALPALAACLLTQNRSLNHRHLLRLAHAVYPFLRAELCLRWNDDELDAALEGCLHALSGMGWLARSERDDMYAAPDIRSDEYAQLALLGQALRPTLIRYFITLATLHRKGSGVITPTELEALCHLQAQRLSLLREFNAPEFFDKTIFRIFIDTLTRNGRAELRGDGRLHFGEALQKASGEARFVLPADVRQAILHMAHTDAETDAPDGAPREAA